MSREDVATVLGSLRLLRGADPGFLARVAQQPRARRQIGAGELIYEAGDPADAIYAAFPAEAGPAAPRAVVELTLPTGDAGIQHHVEHVVAGDAFGEFELVAAGLVEGRAMRRSAARALADCDLYRIPVALLVPVFAENEAIRSRLIRLSMERLISALNVRSSHLLGDRDITLANWLIDTADNLGIAEGRHVRFSRAIGQREIAEALGVARETISLRLNEWERAGLVNTGGQSQRFEILDYPRVALRAAIRKQDAAGAIAAALEEIDADLDHGELVRARNVALDMLTFFASSPELRHRIALANIRAGAVREAVDVLANGGYATGGDIDLLRDRIRLGVRNPGVSPARLFFGDSDAFDDDDPGEGGGAGFSVLVEDVAAIEARARKELAFAARDGGGRKRYAAVSAQFYESIFTATGGTYAGINAAMMARVAGSEDKSSEIAKRIVSRLGKKPEGYWSHATLAEAHLLLGDEKAARAAFDAAASADDVSDGKLSSTRLQVQRIGGPETESILAHLPVGRTAVYAGRPFLGSVLDGAVQETLEAAARPQVEAALSDGNVRYAFGSLTSGLDIVIAETVLAAGGELHVVLPCRVDGFVEAAVAVGNPPGAPDRWIDRFWACLNRSSSLTTAAEAAPPKHAWDAHVFHGFRLAAGLALMRADMLVSHAVMLAAGNGPARGVNAETHRGAREWSAAGRPLVHIPVEGLSAEGEETGADVFAPVVFLWAVDPVTDLAALCDAAAAELGQPFEAAARTSRDRRPGLAIPLSDMETALGLLAALTRACRAARAEARIVADFGPVLDARQRVSDVLVSRLAGASDLIGFPPGTPIATMAFAAEARLTAEHVVTMTPIGRTSAAGQAAESRPLAAREVYALSFAGDTDARYSLASVSFTQS